MKITLDKAANAAYISLANITSGGVSQTHVCDIPGLKGMINLDFDAEGKLVGIEIVEANKILPHELLEA